MKEEEKELTIGEIREVSFNNLNYGVSIKSSHKTDTLVKMKELALEILKQIQVEK